MLVSNTQDMPFYHCPKANVIILTPGATYSHRIYYFWFLQRELPLEEKKTKNS